MDLNKLCTCILVVVLYLSVVDCNKLKKLERGVDILRSKFSTLEQKLYNDEIELRTEIESLWESFNASIVNDNVYEGHNEATFGDHTHHVLDFDKALGAVEERSNSMLKSFAVEKAMVREKIEIFENEFAAIKQQQESALSDFKNASNELLSESNNSLSEALVNANNVLEQQVASVKQKQDNLSVEFNASINDRFADYKEAVNEQNNVTTILLEQSVQAMKVEHDKDFESLRTEAYQMLAGFKDTVDNWQERSNITQEIADNKTYEFQTMIETVKKLSDECTQRTNHLQYFLTNFIAHTLRDLNKFGNSYYKFSTTETTWSKAVEECESLGAHLVVVDSLEENEYLAKKNEDIFWLGGSDLETENNWIWQHNKTSLSFERWNTGEPNGGRKENCLQIKKTDNGRWNDGYCEDNNHYVCELPPDFFLYYESLVK